MGTRNLLTAAAVARAHPVVAHPVLVEAVDLVGEVGYGLTD
jgi:hypothetical protein